MVDFIGLDDVVLCRSMREAIIEHDKVFFSDCVVRDGESLVGRGDDD